MATAAVYYTKPVITQSQISAANTNLDGTGTTVECAAGTGSGSTPRKIDRIRVSATATTAAGNIRFFYSPDGGTTKRLIEELAVTVVAVAAGTNAWKGVAYLEGLALPDSNYKIYASTHIGATFNLHAEMFEA